MKERRRHQRMGATGRSWAVHTVKPAVIRNVSLGGFSVHRVEEDWPEFVELDLMFPDSLTFLQGVSCRKIWEEREDSSTPFTSRDSRRMGYSFLSLDREIKDKLARVAAPAAEAGV